MIELKPCPFCGGEAKIHVGYDHSYVRCENQECLVKTRRYDSIEKATDAWNRRVSE